jgi:peptidoglycan/LPS O-acetylase OafA/YrhL
MLVEASEVGRKSYLDGLRGVAACIVFINHLMLAIFPAVTTLIPGQAHYAVETQIGLLPLGWIWNGSFAVCIFFVLSGYVLSEFCSGTQIGLIAQIARRYTRLALPMLITSAFAFTIMALGLYKNLEAGLLTTKSEWLTMWYRAFEPNFLDMAKESLVGAFINGHSQYNPNLWTMQIELIGSIGVFLVFMLLRTSRGRSFAATALMLVTIQSYYSLFAVGLILFEKEAWLKVVSERMISSPIVLRRVALALLFVGLYLGAYPNATADIQPHWHFFLSRRVPVIGWHMIGAVMVVGAVLFSLPAQSWLGGPVGRYLGRLSFVLYLIHVPVICSLTAWAVIALSGMPYLLNAFLSAIATALVVLSVSAALYLYVDVYTTSLSRRVGKLVNLWTERFNYLHIRLRFAGGKVHTR